MCNFFSLCSNGKGNIFYFNAKQRKRLINSNYDVDSHTSIADYYGYKGVKEDRLNKWEYNPLTKILIAYQINTINDTAFVKKFCDNLNFKTIVPELIVKPITNPESVRKHKVTKKDINNLRKWVDIRSSVRGYIEDFVCNSISNYVDDSVWDSIANYIDDSISNSISNSIWNSVSDSVWDSVWDSAYAYVSSFFDIPYKHDYTPCVKLWERGFIPSFDGKVWRLHQGENMDVVFELK